MGTTLTLPELYAISQSYASSVGEGDERCHWCGAACKRLWFHDDPAPVTYGGVRPKREQPCRVLSSAYQCLGCWLWRRNSITAWWLTPEAGFKDRQKPLELSWLVTAEADGAWALRKEDAAELYAFLLNPERKFALALIDGGAKNYPQLGRVNDNPEVKADTPLYLTLNGVEHPFTAYELGEARKGASTQGMGSGVQALVRLFGPIPAEGKRKRGRPTNAEKNVPQKLIRKSA